MASNTSNRGGPEAERTVLLILTNVGPKESAKSVEVDCPIKLTVGGLKEDNDNLFQIPATQQVWHFKGTLMEDDRSLQFYNVDDGDRITVTRDLQQT